MPESTTSKKANKYRRLVAMRDGEPVKGDRTLFGRIGY